MGSSKVNTHVEFPRVLDMSRYVSSSIHNGERLASSTSSETGSTDINLYKKDNCLYDLFSVVVHIGQLNSGHYIAYIYWDQEVSQ